MAPLKVIGAGFSRCGTDSLRTALNMLGYNCHHMRVMFESDNHAEVFTQAYEHPEIPVDWDTLYEGFDAAVDTPTINFIEPLLEKYPDAKVILTIRDAESWYTSMLSSVFAVRNIWPANMKPYGHEVRRMVHTIVLGGAFGNDRLFYDKENIKAQYEAHNERVKQIVHPERLLLLDMREGIKWERICPFLDKPIPESGEYPYVNNTSSLLSDYPNWIRAMDADTKDVTMNNCEVSPLE